MNEWNFVLYCMDPHPAQYFGVFFQPQENYARCKNWYKQSIDVIHVIQKNKIIRRLATTWELLT
jgi:hypothetical protein